MNPNTLAGRPAPRIVRRGPFLAAGLRYQGTNAHGEIPALWDNEFLPRMGELAAVRVGDEAYGICRMPQDAAPGEFEYLAAVEVRPGAALPPGMVAWEIPAQTYAVLPAQDVPGLAPVSDYFYQEWLPQSDYEAADGPMFEFYPATFAQDLTIQMYFAVRPKAVP